MTKKAKVYVAGIDNGEFHCEIAKLAGYEPKVTARPAECCPTCHSSFMPTRGGYWIEHGGLLLRVCCAMERGLTGITFEEQLDRDDLPVMDIRLA